MDLLDLTLVTAISDAGSITGGAGRANLALPSASSRLRALERELGCELFVRERRGVVLTSAGAAFIRHSREITRAVERMRGDMADYAGIDTSAIRFSANTGAVHSLVEPAVLAFLKAHPHTRVELRERPSEQIVQALLDGRADLGVISDVVETFDLRTRTLRPDPLVVVAAPDHRLRSRRTIGFSEVLEHQLVGLAGPSALQGHIDAHARRVGRTPSYRVVLPDLPAVCGAVCDGIGIAVVPHAAAKPMLTDARLHAVLLKDEWAQRNLVLCVAPDVEINDVTQQLIASVVAHAEASGVVRGGD